MMVKKSSSPNIFIRLVGAFIYQFTKHISFRFLFPDSISSIFESIRMFSLTLQGAQIGKNSYVRNRTFIAYPNKLQLGNNVKIGSDSNIYNYAHFSVGDHTEIGSGLYVQTNEHVFKDKTLPLAKQGAISEKITIGEGVYIGANVTVLKGVCIADLCVIAAGAVVTKNTESGFIYGGIPAQKIKPI